MFSNCPTHSTNFDSNCALCMVSARLIAKAKWDAARGKKWLSIGSR